MTIADTSAWIEFTAGSRSVSAQKVERSLKDMHLNMCFPVLFELLSSPSMTTIADRALRSIPCLDVLPGFWERSAKMRQTLLRRKFRARAMDCLILQRRRA